MLLIEQNLGVAIDVADRIGVMVNGRIAQEMPARELAADRELQERLLGVRSAGDDEAGGAPPQRRPPTRRRRARRRSSPCAAPTATARRRWTTGAAHGARLHPLERRRHRGAGGRHRRACSRATRRDAARAAHRASADGRRCSTSRSPRSSGRAAYVAGTFDTKGRELFFLRQCLEKLGLRVVTVDLSTSGKPSPASVHPREVARHHPEGESAVFSGDRGSAVDARWRSPSSASCARGATSAA